MRMGHMHSSRAGSGAVDRGLSLIGGHGRITGAVAADGWCARAGQLTVCIGAARGSMHRW